jgi:hypothetical protein
LLLVYRVHIRKDKYLLIADSVLCEVVKMS